MSPVTAPSHSKIENMIARYSGKKTLFLVAGLSLCTWLFEGWVSANPNPADTKDVAVAFMWAIAIIVAGTAIGQGIGDHGQKNGTTRPSI